MRSVLKKSLLTAALACWVGAVVLGGIKLWNYDAHPGTSAEPPQHWPAHLTFNPNPHLPSLVILIHPRCPCTRATLGELARLMTQCHEKLTATVLVMHPSHLPDDWSHTDLWTTAAAIPGVTVLADPDGKQAASFGAATSGTTLLYSADGHLLFAGGITESRGHMGDNAGESAIESLVLTRTAAPSLPAHSPVYGCSLLDPSPLTMEGSSTCRP